MVLADWLTLALTPGLDGQRLAKLLERFGSPRDLLKTDPGRHSPDHDNLPPRFRFVAPDVRQIAATEQWLSNPNRHCVPWTSDDYPELLRQISNPPVLLFVHGDIEALHMPQLAIVGSRNATGPGLDNARRFAHGLAASGLTVTSGLAHGIDSAAHRAALRASGKTIAVCGTGPDQVYPRAHRSLAGAITKQGALISEYLPGTPPRAAQFPRRNRIISGLSLGTLVVEAGRRSGAMITARLAGEQGREVFALPGSIHNPLSRGCHRLLRDGATLVESLNDIGECIGPMLGSCRETIRQNMAVDHVASAEQCPTDERRHLLSCLGWDPMSINDLVAKSGLTAAEVSSMLLILELENRVLSLPGGRYQQREEGVHDERNRA